MAKWDITKAKCPNCEETFQMYVDANEARIDAETKLARAVEAAQQLASDATPCACHDCIEARTTLAELTGGKDE